MTINEAMKTYRLPNPTTPEDLECRWSKVLNFGDKVLLAGYYYSGKSKPSYFGAVYEHLDDDMSCEGTIGRGSGNTNLKMTAMRCIGDETIKQDTGRDCRVTE